MKGYYTDFGYIGYINGRWQLFSTEQEYVETYRSESIEK
jgi:hypothetical protein